MNSRLNDRLKHKLYDAFLKDTPIKFDNVTDKQWEEMQSTFVGFSITLNDAVEGAVEAMVNWAKGRTNGR